MKNRHFIGVFVVALLAICTLISCGINEDENESENNSSKVEDLSSEYVDLGLPSETKWKTTNECYNETCYHDFDDAVGTFGGSLPIKEQWEELKSYCYWQLQRDGSYKVVGPNGNSIVLPAEGMRTCSGKIEDVGSFGRYWSSTPRGSEGAWYLNFDSCKISINSYDLRCRGLSIRLVHN